MHRDPFRHAMCMEPFRRANVQCDAERFRHANVQCDAEPFRHANVQCDAEPFRRGPKSYNYPALNTWPARPAEPFRHGAILARYSGAHG